MMNVQSVQSNWKYRFSAADEQDMQKQGEAEGAQGAYNIGQGPASEDAVGGVDGADIDESGLGGISDSKASEAPRGRRLYDEYVKGDNEEGRPEGGGSEKSEPETSESCTVNTDKVDREIKKLREEKQQAQRQLDSCDDPKKAEELERKLTQLENELKQKDNDGYRRRNAVFS